jgi:hypothetical protein
MIFLVHAKKSELCGMSRKRGRSKNSDATRQQQENKVKRVCEEASKEKIVTRNDTNKTINKEEVNNDAFEGYDMRMDRG